MSWVVGMAGLIVGGGLSQVALAFSVAFPHVLPGPLDSLLGQPAVGSVPAAFLAMIVVSLLTRAKVTPRAEAVLAVLHLPSANRAGGRPSNS